MSIMELRRRVEAMRAAIAAAEFDDDPRDGGGAIRAVNTDLPPLIGGPAPSVAGLPEPLAAVYRVFDGAACFPFMELATAAEVSKAMAERPRGGPIGELLRDRAGLGTIAVSDHVTAHRETGAVAVFWVDDYMYLEENEIPVDAEVEVADPAEFFARYVFGSDYPVFAPGDGPDPWRDLLRTAGLL